MKLALKVLFGLVLAIAAFAGFVTLLDWIVERFA